MTRREHLIVLLRHLAHEFSNNPLLFNALTEAADLLESETPSPKE